MTQRLRILTAALATLLVLSTLTATREAHAQGDAMELLILSFKGPGGKNLRNRLVKTFSTNDLVNLVPRKNAITTGKKLGIPASSTKTTHLVKLGENMGFDATIIGEVMAGPDGTKNLTVTVLLTLDPDNSEEFIYTWKAKVAPQSIVDQVATDIMTSVGTSIHPTEEITPYVIEEEDDIEVEDETPKKPQKKYEKGHVIYVHAGMMIGARKLTITTDPPPYTEYDGGAFPAIDAELRFYPARIATSHPAAGIGLGLFFTRSLGLNTQLPGSSAELDTALTVFELKLLYEIPLGRSPLWLGFGVGWGLLHYTIDTGAAPPLSVRDFKYKNVLIGANLRIIAVPERLTIEVGGDLRIPHSWGDAETAYGASAGGIGTTVRLGFSGGIIKGFSWSAGIDYTFMKTTYEGDCSQPFACITAQADSAKDHYPAGYLRIGYEW